MHRQLLLFGVLAGITMLLAVLNVIADDGDIEVEFQLPQSETTARALAESADGTVWVGVSDGVKRFGPNGDFQNFVIPVREVRKIVTMTNENLLVASGLDHLIMISTSGVVNAAVTANAAVSDLAKQRDGKILVAGAFTILNGKVRPYLGRLNPDGSLDESFRPPTLIGNTAAALKVIEQPDGRIIAAGFFDYAGDTARAGIARFTSLGELDPNYNPGTNVLPTIGFPSTEFGRFITGLAFLGNDLVVTGLFGRTNNVYEVVSQTVRFSPEGNLVQILSTEGGGPSVFSIASQPDGKLLMSPFLPDDGGTESPVARITEDGALDSEFSIDWGNPYGINIFVTEPGHTFLSGMGVASGYFLYRITNHLKGGVLRLDDLNITAERKIAFSLNSPKAGNAQIEVSPDLKNWRLAITEEVQEGTNKMELPNAEPNAFVRASLSE